MSHINSLLVNFFFEFMQELFINGNIYVGMPPKYSYQDSRGNFHYIKNDLELKEFELDYIAKDVDILNSKNVNLDKFMEIKNMYQQEFNNITYQYSVSPSLLSKILIPEDVKYIDEIIREVGLEYDPETDQVSGIYEEEWHDFYIDDLLDNLNRITGLHEFKERIEFTYKDEKYKMYPIDFIEFINKTYNFKYNYFKGLGEASPQELFETTIGPERNLIKLEVSDIEKTEELMDNMFNSNRTKARRELMRTYLG